MVTKYGMSDKLGPMVIDKEGGRVIGGAIVGGAPYSEALAKEVDDEMTRIIDSAKVRAEEVLTQHKKTLDLIAEKLIETETLERAEFEKLLLLGGIEPKKEKKKDKKERGEGHE